MHLNTEANKTKRRYPTYHACDDVKLKWPRRADDSSLTLKRRYILQLLSTYQTGYLVQPLSQLSFNISSRCIKNFWYFHFIKALVLFKIALVQFRFKEVRCVAKWYKEPWKQNWWTIMLVLKKLLWITYITSVCMS